MNYKSDKFYYFDDVYGITVVVIRYIQIHFHLYRHSHNLIRTVLLQSLYRSDLFSSSVQKSASKCEASYLIFNNHCMEWWTIKQYGHPFRSVKKELLHHMLLLLWMMEIFYMLTKLFWHSSVRFSNELSKCKNGINK